MKRILAAIVSLVFIVVSGFYYLSADSPLSTKVVLPYRTDTKPDEPIIATSAKNATTKQFSRLQQQEQQEHQRNAPIKSPTPSNPKQHVSFKILRPVNWHLMDTIDPYDGLLKVKENVSAATREIYFSVKTTQGNHATRLPVLILTWMQTVIPTQV